MLTTFVTATPFLAAVIVFSAQISLSDAFMAPPHAPHVPTSTSRSIGEAFVPVLSSHGSSSRVPSTALNMAGKKKKRRRRKDAPPPKKAGDPPSEGAEFVPALDDDDGELPDFDLDEEAELAEKKAPAAAAAAAAASSSPSSSISPPTDAAPMSSMDSVDMSDPKIREAMRGSKSARKSSGTMDDLLRDRELEKSFTFDDSKTKEDLPSIGDSKGRSSRADAGGTGRGGGSFVVEEKMGTKRARAEARRAAAREAEEAAQEGGLLKNVDFVKGEDGEVSGVKVLEAGAWAGIAILVLWEVYINSPLFERAAPMVPVVYEFLM